MDLSLLQWLIVDDKALTQALKVATGYPHILPSLVWNAYQVRNPYPSPDSHFDNLHFMLVAFDIFIQEYLWSLRVYSKEHDALHDLYSEVWKLFVKEKVGTMNHSYTQLAS
jgi:hypothetical protein